MDRSLLLGGRGRRELTESWKDISRSWAIGSLIAIREVGRWRKRRNPNKTHDSSLCQSSRYPRRRLSKTPGPKFGAIRRGKLGQDSKGPNKIMLSKFQKCQSA